MNIVHYHRPSNRVWIVSQRIHHGPVGLMGGILILALIPHPYRLVGIPLVMWGLSDAHDIGIWFKRDIYSLSERE